jgi:2-desacetyl-2-hydroxyethyl bacteriochlorophyllide A dehydrogenase
MFFVKANPSISIAALPGVPRVFMGHELIGRVIETGKDVTGLSEGDRVTLQAYLPCCSMKEINPPCGPCQEGNYTLCENFAEGEMYDDLGAGFGDHFIAHQSQLVKVPSDITDDMAVMIEPTAVSMHAVLTRPPRDGEKVLVIGAGTIGLNVIQFAKAINPECTVYVMEKIDFKKDLARNMGADDVLTGDPYERVSRVTGGKLYRGPFGNNTILGGFHLIYDCVGHSQTLHHSLRWLKSRGDYILIGTQLSPVSFDYTPVWNQELRIRGINAHGRENYQGKEMSSFELAMEMIRDGKVSMDGFITHKFRLHEYKRAFKQVRDKKGQVIKAVFEIE